MPGKNISFTCTGSGKCLACPDTLDVYSLFGNLLENAIAATEQLENQEQRIISLSIEQRGDFIHIHTMNFFQGPAPTLEDGLPRTTKETEFGYHGYGLKSVRAIARRYNGDLSIAFQDGIFTAQVYLIQNEIT